MRSVSGGIGLKKKLEEIRKAALEECSRASTVDELEDFRVRYLGKKGVLTQVLRGMGDVPAEERPVIGKLANSIKNEVQMALDERRDELGRAEQEKHLEAETVDITLPGKRPPLGSRHPITMVIDEIKHIFMGLGFEVVQGPEIEEEYYNFEALNVPPDHPARDMQDTFYINERFLLRTQTSPVQIRTMEMRRPPLRIVAPGKVYRVDADVTHSPMFHQVEGLAVDYNVTFADLKNTLTAFAEELYGEGCRVRFRPSYFPFTEPSAEMDVGCVMCGGAGCRVCSGTGWLEILGAGMVHPRVFEMVDYDPEEVSGFAFGLGVERIAMAKYGIDDIRLLFENDIRFLRQFA